MNRRIAINNIVILSLGAVVLPSCNQPNQAMVNLKNLSLTGSEQKLVNQLAETIIPKTSFIGASDLNTHVFILRMVDDCYDPDQQKKFTIGLKEFNQLAIDQYGGSFTAIAMAQRTALLTSIEMKKDIPEGIVFFYETTKRYTLQAFTSSKEFMTEVINYKMVPGSNFNGCVPVKKA